jgi:hypothetical protein
MEQSLELIDGAVPEALMTIDPRPSGLQSLLSQAKPVDATLYAALDQPGLFEDLEMARDSWLGRAELLAELASAACLAPRQRVDH